MFNQKELEEKYNLELGRVRKHKAGAYKGTSLEGDYWQEIARGNAVRLGNLHKKKFGIRPAGFDELKKGRI